MEEENIALKHPKPDYVLSFSKPSNTEIKYVYGNWYLYERVSVYDKEKKRTRKKTGRYIGTITPTGLKKKHRFEKGEHSSSPSDNVEAGASCFLYDNSKEMRTRLKNIFPDIWKEIYTLSLIRTIYDPIFSRSKLHYENCALSYLIPDLSLNPTSIRSLLEELGGRREKIVSYMREDIKKCGHFILFDGHRILSRSSCMEGAEKGYDSQQRYENQLNVIYMFSEDEEESFPLFYKSFDGGIPDVSAFKSTILESGVKEKDVTLVCDKGCGSDENRTLLEESGLFYIMSLKRGSKIVEGKVPSSIKEYDEDFMYRKRAISSKVIKEDENSKYILFYDSELFSDEHSSKTERDEKKNNAIKMRRVSEEKRREKGKGRLSDEEFSSLSVKTREELYKNTEEMGTILIKTNRKELTSKEVYFAYKNREHIEQFYRTYNSTLSFNASYLDSRRKEEAWLFLNHLSSTLTNTLIELIYSKGKLSEYSFADLMETMKKVRASKYGDEWKVEHIKKSTQSVYTSLSLDSGNVSSLNEALLKEKKEQEELLKEVDKMVNGDRKGKLDT